MPCKMPTVTSVDGRNKVHCRTWELMSGSLSSPFLDIIPSNCEDQHSSIVALFPLADSQEQIFVFAFLDTIPSNCWDLRLTRSILAYFLAVSQEFDEQGAYITEIDLQTSHFSTDLRVVQLASHAWIGVGRNSANYVAKIADSTPTIRRPDLPKIRSIFGCLPSIT